MDDQTRITWTPGPLAEPLERALKERQFRSPQALIDFAVRRQLERWDADARSDKDD